MAVKLSQSDKDRFNFFPQLSQLVEIINTSEANSSNLQHASNLLSKIRKTKDAEKTRALAGILPHYIAYHKAQAQIKSFNQEAWDAEMLTEEQNESIRKRVDLLEKYYSRFDEYELDRHFSSQGKFRSTILEEFMCYLFQDFVDVIKERYHDGKGKDGVIFNGASKSYTNMYIAPTDIEDFILRPQMEVNEKDQDYAIYRKIKITIDDSSEKKYANIPILAIENKTFLDKTMLDGAIATADKVKTGNPYALYLVVTETYDVSVDVDPIYSRIDQIYVLRKCKRDRNNHAPASIDKEIVIRMFEKVVRHMHRPWSKIQDRLESRGEIMY